MGKNVISADNPQERPKLASWVVGFIEGEGTFSVSIYRNRSTKIGWQVFPEFVVTQGKSNKQALELLQEFFGCGHIYRNSKPRSTHREDVYRFCVRSLDELKGTIIPFFHRYRLRTNKAREFKRFVEVVREIEKKKHLTDKGLRKIAHIVRLMNRRVPSKFLASSETIRRSRLRR